MDNKEITKGINSFLLGRKAPVTIIGVLLLGIAGSALYDLFVKPGINSISRFIFDILTFGSQKIIDYSFNTAALDPTAIPSLVLLIALAVFAIDYPVRKYIRALLLMRKKDKSRPTERKIKIIIPLMLIVNIVIVFIPLNVYNQAVVTWRVFHANLTILAPAINQEKYKELKSSFASMRTESDYRIIESSMKVLAKNNNISLRGESPW